MPHSHDDTGWIRTVDEYYEEQVRFTYDSVVRELLLRPDRRFVFVEMAYFARWWREADDGMRDAVRRLTLRCAPLPVHPSRAPRRADRRPARSGQVEFVNGGWCMADEAVTSAPALVDQLTLGHRFILDTVGAVPRFGWHIDPFGAAASTPLLMQALGYDGFVINRIDYRLKEAWKTAQHLQFHWYPSNVSAPLGGGTARPGIFTHVLDSHYSAVDGFDWEDFGENGGNDINFATRNIPIFARAPSRFQPATLEARAAAYVAAIKERAAWFRLGAPYQAQPAVLIPFGDDFKWQNAYVQFRNFDLLRDYINANSARFGVQVRYSTLTEYFRNVLDDYDGWPVYEGDFFPYASGEQDYFTGFYTSRPETKGNMRLAMGRKRAAEVARSLMCAGLSAAANHGGAGSNDAPAMCRRPPVGDADDMMLAREVTAVGQHHDAITGTSNFRVNDDWNVRFRAAARASAEAAALAVSRLVDRQDRLRLSPDAADAMRGLVERSAPVAMVLFNGLGRPQRHLVSVLNVPLSDIVVRNASGATVPFQLEQSVPTQARRAAPAAGDVAYTLRFVAHVPPAGYATYFIARSSAAAASSAPPLAWACYDPAQPLPADTRICGDATCLWFDSSTHRVSGISSGGGGPTRRLEQDFVLYDSLGGSNAYFFQPNLTHAPTGRPLLPASNPRLCRLVGPVVQHVVQDFTANISQTWSAPVGLDARVGRIVVEDDVRLGQPNTELVTRFRTSIDNRSPDGKPVLFADANGLQLRAHETNRTVWHRWSDNVTSPVAGNYLPFTQLVRIRQRPAVAGDELVLLADRAHGAASLAAGWLEIMLHRRCHEGDAVIPLNDTSRIRAAFWLYFGPATGAGGPTAAARLAAPQLYTPPLALFASAPADWPYAGHWSGLAQPLPTNVELFSLDRVGIEGTPEAVASRYLLRLHHLFGDGDDADLSVPVTVDLTRLFAAPLRPSSITEATLSGNAQVAPPGLSDRVTLYPMQIRTFELALTAATAPAAAVAAV